ncbi:phage baseplate assembly protein V [Candidatus Vondammii sp. HM_W22]|uniref:phage baseplate assembly protein V n=1 Tax=Candidatus Vondammii sp. HM_W22 TaxID=2687299 RepID=UPI001F149599|nr:phage baseplate assembly protein V [Candidatus Vondammii sp. HM_W22]
MRRLLAPLTRRLRIMVSRAVINLVNDGHGLQEVQITLLADETAEVERVQEYGFTSNPQPGAEAVALAVGGSRAHTIVIATDDRRYRLKGLASGEVALYDDMGQSFILHRDRIEVTSPKVVINSDDIHLAGEGGGRIARVGDKVEVGGGSSAGLWPIVEGSEKVRCS